MSYILSLDEGTTSCRAMLFNEQGKICGVAQREFTQYYPNPSWVEHDAIEILDKQLITAKEVIKKVGADINDIKGIGITNQRETTVVWDRHTGKPICNAIVWQCRRTADICQKLKNKWLINWFKQKTGLVIDAYFSATKIKWILDNIDGAREKAENGDLLFGTIDTWLIWNLTEGKVHVTDYTNASRTMLFNIKTLQWDEEILQLLKIPKCMLPKVKPSSFIYGYTTKKYFNKEIPISGIAGDQQAALFGQLCVNKGDIKTTYGTGCFMLANIGDKPLISNNGLLTTIAWGIDDKVIYALEGSVFMAGAVVQWLRDNLGIIKTAEETEQLALSVMDTDGVYLVPAFQGLGAPYWNMYAHAALLGMTRKTHKAHIVRAGLESICYRVKDVVEAMQNDLNDKCNALKVDGGAAKNNFLLQFQSDILNIPVIRPKNVETTAKGAAFLAGLAVGFWDSTKKLRSLWEVDNIFESEISEIRRQQLYGGWKKSVSDVINNIKNTN